MAHRLLFWSSDRGAASPSAFAALEDATAAVGGAQPEPWTAQVAAQRATTENQAQGHRAGRSASAAERDLHVVSFSASQTLYLVHKPNKQVLEAGADAKSLLDSYLKYKTRASLQLEGVTYTAGDFAIGLLRTTQRPSNRFAGLVIDISYSPLLNAGAAAAVLDEMALMFKEAAEAAVPGALVEQVPDLFAEYGLQNEAFSRQHLAVQLVATHALIG